MTPLYHCLAVRIANATDSCESGSTTSGPIAAAQGFVAATTPSGAAHLNSVHIIAIGFTSSNAALDLVARAGGTTAAHYINDEAALESTLNTIASSLVPSVSVTGSTTVCTNGTAGTATETNASAWGFRTVSGGAVTAIPGATNATYLIRGSDFPGVGTFYLVAGSCSFGSVSDEITVTVTAPPAATISAPSQVVAGRSATASVADAGAGASYTWSVSGATFSGQGSRTISFTAGASGSVMLGVSVQNAVGCVSSNSQSVLIVAPFTDDPLVTGSTIIKAAHLTEIRDSTNYIRSKGGLPAVMWTDTAAPGLVIQASQIIEVRNALTPALMALGTTPTYTDPNLGPGNIVKAVHVQEIRDYTR